MEEMYEYIDAYFTNTLAESERKIFEERCVADAKFAGQVALYISSRQAVRHELLQRKQQQWAPVTPLKRESKTLVRRLLPYAAAACLVLAVAMLYIIKSPSPHQLADKYQQQYMAHINVEMGSGDSLQNAIAAFNAKNYTKAKSMFELLQLNGPGNADVKKYTGYVYLFTQEYDKALQQFEELAKMNLKSNPGNFLQAVTLMERDEAGDKEKAKQLLEKVASGDTENAEQAKEWLKKF